MRAALLAAFCGLIGSTSFAQTATPREERAALAKVTTSIKAAERLAKAKRNDDAAERFKTAADLFAEIAKAQLSEQAKPLFERVKKQLTESHGKLKAQGLDLPPLEESEFQGAPETEAMADARGGPPSTPGKTSFTRQVAPILMQHCGNCHVRATKGDFNASSHSSLMAAAGSNGQIVQPGAGSESPLVMLITNGEMPPKGQVPPEDLRTLVDWINEGAMFDGDDPSANLTTFARSRPRGGERSMAPEPKVTRPTGRETVSFALDIAPILSANCVGCHNAQQPDAELNLSTFAGILRGGESGPVVKPGESNQSPLHRRTTGEDQPIMPPEGDPLLKEVTDKIATWISEGATFDGLSPDEPLERSTAIVRAKKASPEELSAIRAELAQKNWKLALPDVAPQTTDTLHLHLVGSVTADELSALGAVAETQVEAVLKLLGGKVPGEFSKSRVTLYAFGNRIDFSEFGQMVVGRPATSGQLSSSGYTIEDSYVAIVPSQDNELELAEQLALTYLREQTQGRMPEWFAAGIARTAAAKIHAKNDRVAAWRTNAPSVLAGVQSCPDLMGDRLPPESSATARFAFTETLLKHRGGVQKYLALAKDENTPADDAFVKAYGAPAEELVTLWLKSVKK